MTLTECLRLPEHVAASKLGDETVLLNVETGMYFTLDAVGSRFLELLQQDGHIAAAHQALLQEFDVDPEVLKSDILRLAEEMQAKGLLEVVG